MPVRKYIALITVDDAGKLGPMEYLDVETLKAQILAAVPVAPPVTPPVVTPPVVTPPVTPPVVAPPVTPPSPATGPKNGNKIAVNFIKLTDYGVRGVSNAALQGRQWVDTAANNRTMSRGELAQGDDGLPRTIPQGTRPGSILIWDGGAAEWPAGAYVANVAGSGWEIRSQRGRVLATANGAFQYNPANDGGMMLVLSQPITSASIRPQGETGTFSPDVIAALRPFSCIRFMDAQATNFSSVTDTLTPANAFSWAGQKWSLNGSSIMPAGIPPEAIGELCRTIDCDAWVCMPALCTDDYVRAFATRLKAAMPVNRRVIVELSNEGWNSQFPVQQQLGNGNWQTFLANFTRRTVEVTNIFRGVYGPNAVRVLGAQTGNEGTFTGPLDTVLNGSRVSTQLDGVAIAPYFGHSLGGTGVTRAKLAAAVDVAISQMRRASQECASRGVKLFAYEAGSHVQGRNEMAYTSDEAAEIRRYLQAWKALGNTDVITWYNLSEFAGSDTWGAMRGSKDLQSPRYRAIIAEAS